MNRNLFSTLCCALLCSVFFCPVAQAQLTIVSAKAPQLTFDSDEIRLNANGFNIENNSCDFNVIKSWSILNANKVPIITYNNTIFSAYHRFEEVDLDKKYYFRYSVKDTCGNRDSVDFLLDLKKEMLLNFECVPVIIGANEHRGFVKANEFYRSKQPNSQPVELKIEGTRQFYFNPNKLPADSLPINCSMFTIRLSVREEKKEWQTCITYLYVDGEINNPSDDCGIIADPTFSRFISGNVTTSNGKIMDNAFMEVITFPNKQRYSVKTKIGKYTVVLYTYRDAFLYPFKDDMPLNGVSLFDILLLNKHILETQIITNPYSLIAGDINNNGKITTADVVELRKVILGIQTTFKNNKSWRFFDKRFKEKIWIDNIEKDTIINFTAVKIGDINDNVNAASTPRASKTHTFKLENKELPEGDTYTLSLNGIEGFAFTMRYDADKLELMNLDDNSALIENGVITTAQVDSEFKAIFKAKAKVTLSEAIHINSDITQVEAIVAGEVQDISLQFSHNKAILETKIYPNPVADFLAIETSINSEGEVVICNSLGQVLANQLFSGSEKIIMNLSDLPKGIYWLTLKTNKGNNSTKLIKE